MSVHLSTDIIHINYPDHISDDHKKTNANIHSLVFTFFRSENLDIPISTFTWKYLTQTTSMSLCEGSNQYLIVNILHNILKKVKNIVAPNKGETEVWWNPILPNIWCTMCHTLDAKYPGNTNLVAIAWITSCASPKFLSENNDPLWCAALYDNKLLWEQLISRGASPYLCEPKKKESLLHRIFYSIKKPFTADMVSFLIERGMDPNRLDAKGWSPLHHAISEQHHEAVALLLKKGAHLNNLSNTKTCPIALAVALDDKDLTMQLIEAGANPLLAVVDEQVGKAWHLAQSQMIAHLVDQAAGGVFSEWNRRTMLSHRFALPIKTKIQNRYLPTEGWVANSKTLVASSIYESFINSLTLYVSEQWLGLSEETTKEFLDTLSSLNPDSPEASPEKLAWKYRNKKIVAVESSWKGHATFTVICPKKQILIHCNKGNRKEGREAGMWVAFVGDPTSVDAAFFKKLQSEDRNYIESKMVEELKLHHFCHIPEEDQEGGFCMWDNLVLAGVATAILFHGRASNRQPQNLHDTERDLQKAARWIRPFFAKWVIWDQGHFLEECLNHYETTQSEGPDFLQLLFILGRYRGEMAKKERLINLLKKYTINLEQVDQSGRNILHYLSHSDQMQTIQSLENPLTIDNTLRRLVNQSDQTDWGTPLRRAIQTDNIPVAHSLISLGANVHLLDKNERTPLCIAVQLGCSLEMIELLLRNGANPIAFSPIKGFVETSPIFQAMMLNELQALKLMLTYVHPKSLFIAGMLFQWAILALKEPEVSKSVTRTLLRHYHEANIKKILIQGMIDFSIAEGLIPIIYEAIISTDDHDFIVVYDVLKQVLGMPAELIQLLESRKNNTLPPRLPHAISVHNRLGIISFANSLIFELISRSKLDVLPLFLDALGCANLSLLSKFFPSSNLQPYLQAIAIWEAIGQGNEQKAIQSVTETTYFGPIGKWEITLLKRARIRQMPLLEKKLLDVGALDSDFVD